MPCSLAECWYSKRGRVPYTTPLKKNSQPISKCLCQWQSWIWEWSAAARQLELPCLRLIGQIRCWVFFFSFPSLPPSALMQSRLQNFQVSIYQINFRLFFISNWYVKNIHSSISYKISFPNIWDNVGSINNTEKTLNCMDSSTYQLHWHSGKHKRCYKNWRGSSKIFLKNSTTLWLPVFINFNGWMHKCCWNLGASALS